jgi:aspartate kinase
VHWKGAVRSRVELRALRGGRQQGSVGFVALVVQKYGGTSVGDAERIRGVARRVVATAERGAGVCVVVSAMGETTDQLLELAAQISPAPPARELDMLLTAGERISMALLSMAIIELGREAISLTGSQAGIVTDTKHGKARIVDVRARRVLEALDAGKIVIVAGFQGVSTDYDVTTLGRGGSDTTAVALAAAMGADVCEIFSDVQGVFTADPRIVNEARKLHAVSYEEMLELSACGAKVLMLRSVEYARNHGVLLHVRSSFSEEEGTWIREEDVRMEQAIISGIAHDTSEAKVTVRGVPDHPGIAARIFRSLAEEGISVDMIVQSASESDRTDISFTLPNEDLRRAEPVLAESARDVGAADVTTDPSVAKISLVGAGMKSHPGVAADMFEALADAGINIDVISTSSIRISCVVHETHGERAVRAIHDRFRLSEEVVLREKHPATVTDQLRALRVDRGDSS